MNLGKIFILLFNYLILYLFNSFKFKKMYETLFTKNKALVSPTLQSFFTKSKRFKLAKKSANFLPKEKVLLYQEPNSMLSNSNKKNNISNSKKTLPADNSSNNILISTRSSISKKKFNTTNYKWNTYKKNNVVPSSTSINFFKKNQKNSIKQNNYIRKNNYNSKNNMKSGRDYSAEQKYILNKKLFANFIDKYETTVKKIIGETEIKTKQKEHFLKKNNNAIKIFDDLPYLNLKNNDKEDEKFDANSERKIKIKKTDNYKQKNFINKYNDKKTYESVSKKTKSSRFFTIKDYNNTKNEYNTLTYSNSGSNNKNKIYLDSNTHSKKIKINSDNYSYNSNLNPKNKTINFFKNAKPQIIDEKINKENINPKTTRTISTVPSQLKKNFEKQKNNFSQNRNILPQNVDLTMKLSEICKYDIGENIGKGAYAVVKMITNRVTKENFAMKIYEKSTLNDSSKKRCAIREIEILKRINHKNIAKLIGIINTDTKILIIQEFVKGISLRDYYNDEIRNQKGISEHKAKIFKKIFYQIFDAMNYIHKNYMAHRDIKLENILMTKEYEIKIIDFGFGMYNPQNKLQTFYCGTPNYMPPEITIKKPYIGQKADLWSLGVLVYKMFCADFPFKGKNKKELYENIRIGKFNIANYTPEYAKKIIIGLIEKNPDKRMTCENVLKSEWLRDYE